MKRCEKCGYKFNMRDGLKSYLKNIIECPNCNSRFKKQSRLIYLSFISVIDVQIYINAISDITLLNVSIYLLISFIIWTIFEIVPHKLHSYKEIE